MRCDHGFELGLGYCPSCEIPRRSERRTGLLIKCGACKRSLPREKMQGERSRYCGCGGPANMNLGMQVT